MKEFILPGFFEQFETNKKLIQLYEEHPDYFVDNFSFGCFYGIFGYNIWGGGRVFQTYKRGYFEDLIEIKDFYESKNIPIRLTLTNPLIEEKHLYDKFANMTVNILHNGKHEILTSSPVLEKYLKTEYPNFKYCSSTTKCLTNQSQAASEIKESDYHQICIDYNLNHNFEWLDKFDQEQKNKIEFLCNAICPPGCPSRKEHYRLNGVSMFMAGKFYTVECSINGNTVSPSCMGYKNNISPEEIEKVFEPKGFKNFKLEGRTLSPAELAANYVRYLIKPEYQMFAISYLL